MSSGYAITNRFIGSISDFLLSIILLLIFFLCVKNFTKKNNLNINLGETLIIYRAVILFFTLYYAS